VPLTVFGALFMSADKMFATMVEDLVLIDLQALASHLLVIAIVGWIVCGYLVRVASGMTLPRGSSLPARAPKLGVVEVATALGLVDLLFLGFVSVQFRYLFGGGSWVQVTPDLTYATYARAGFFQLVVAVALAIPWLLTAQSLIGEGTWKARSVFRAFAGVHVLLLLVVVASAVQRMLVYQSAYGLTEMRVIVTACLLWLTGIVIWFGATVLSGHRNRFAYGVLVSAFALVGTLQFINPAGLAARHNLDRTTGSGGVDVEYLAYQDGDAVPLLLSRLDEFTGEEQCRVAKELLRQWGPEQPGVWKSFNWAESRARKAVGEEQGTLQSLVGTEGCD